MADEYHQCHFCGEWVKDGKDPRGNRNESREWGSEHIHFFEDGPM